MPDPIINYKAVLVCGKEPANNPCDSECHNIFVDVDGEKVVFDINTMRDLSETADALYYQHEIRIVPVYEGQDEMAHIQEGEELIGSSFSTFKLALIASLDVC